MRDTIELCNRDLKKSIFTDIMFFSLAEGGAMGEPGGDATLKVDTNR